MITEGGGGVITEGHKPGVQPVMDSIIFIVIIISNSSIRFNLYY